MWPIKLQWHWPVRYRIALSHTWRRRIEWKGKVSTVVANFCPSRPSDRHTKTAKCLSDGMSFGAHFAFNVRTGKGPPGGSPKFKANIGKGWWLALEPDRGRWVSTCPHPVNGMSTCLTAISHLLVCGHQKSPISGNRLLISDNPSFVKLSTRQTCSLVRTMSAFIALERTTNCRVHPAPWLPWAVIQLEMRPDIFVHIHVGFTSGSNGANVLSHRWRNRFLEARRFGFLSAVGCRHSCQPWLHFSSPIPRRLAANRRLDKMIARAFRFLRSFSAIFSCWRN